MQLFTPAQYSEADVEGKDLDVEALSSIFPPRAQLLGARVRVINGAGGRPNIMEIGPGTFWLPHSLRARGLSFTYEYQALHRADLPFDAPKGDGQNIFVAFELIEHLANEAEIYEAYLKFKKKADFIYLSTPLYTYGGGNPDWQNGALGHLRTYTPQEFGKFALEFWPEHQWTAHLSDTITLEGVLNG